MDNIISRSNRLRVIVNDLNLGGTETHLSRLLPALANDYGWKITVFLFEDKLYYLDTLKNAGIDVVYPRLHKSLTWMPKKIQKILMHFLAFAYISYDFVKDRSSITQFFLPKAYLMGMTAAWLTRLPAKKILNRRSLNHYQEKKWGVRWLEKQFHCIVDGILVNSEKIKNQLSEKEAVSLSRVRVIYNGLPPLDRSYIENKSGYRKKISEILEIPENAWLFIQVANFISYKGHLDLFQALSRLKYQNILNKPFYLVCLGSDMGGGYEKTLRQAVAQLEIENNVHFIGQRKNVFDWYAGSDIGLLCSHEEGFSNAILEGMAVGLPMIVTDVGGNPESVLDRKTGLVISTRSPKAIAEAILKLCQDDLIRAEFGKAARERIKSHFQLQECVRRHDQFYQEVGR